MKIYTKNGDNGSTTLANGESVKKNDQRVIVYGTLDELNAYVGLLASMFEQKEREFLYEIQRHLFGIGSVIALSTLVKHSPTGKDVEKLENVIDSLEQFIGGFNGFVLPGGSLISSYAEVCRTVCRRAERQLYDLSDQVLSPCIKQYMNRLSDYFYYLARYQNSVARVEEIKV